MNDSNDVEKAASITNHADPSYESATPGEIFTVGDSLYARLQRLAGRLHVEQRGIERVPEDERNDTSLLNVGTMWLSANMVVSSFAIGLLAQRLFYLGFIDAVLTCLFFNLLGVLPVCYFSTFGARFGLRQMVLSRFWFGWRGVKVVATLNALACLGWSSINTIVGAQLLHAVSPDHLPGYAGILIISLSTLFITFFGYNLVHIYEYYSWIPTFIVFLIALGVFAHSGDFVPIPMGAGTSELGGVLGFGSVVYGFATGWASYGADYTVYQPATQSRRRIFGAVWLGLIFPLLFTETLGIALMTATTLNNGDNRYMAMYESSHTGGLLAAVLFPPLGNFGRFCLVVLALSIVANNCPNIYSVGLTVQVLARRTQRVPRWIWTAVATAVYVAVSVPGYSHFEEVLENFMNFIGYWLAIYEGIALCEHFVFRRSMHSYDPADYNTPEKLPPGIAAVFAFCCGVAGMITGMSQTWYVGPIALKAGEPPYGGDVGFELGFALAFVSYAGARTVEKRWFYR